MTTRKTARAIALFVGTDSACRSIEVVYREDGQPFYRAYEYNGFAAGWSKWRRLDAAKEASVDEACEAKSFSWGFKTLAGGRMEDLTFRLPLG